MRMVADNYSEAQCAQRWTAALAPRTGDLRSELTLELSEYFKRPVAAIEAQLAGATERFTDEWRRRVHDPRDEKAVTRFYNESDTELFDLARWHVEDPIHFRTLVCCDAAVAGAGREYLDYGSGIRSTRWYSRRPVSTSRSPTWPIHFSPSRDGDANGAA